MYLYLLKIIQLSTPRTSCNHYDGLFKKYTGQMSTYDKINHIPDKIIDFPQSSLNTYIFDIF